MYWVGDLPNAQVCDLGLGPASVVQLSYACCSMEQPEPPRCDLRMPEEATIQRDHQQECPVPESSQCVECDLPGFVLVPCSLAL